MRVISIATQQSRTRLRTLTSSSRPPTHRSPHLTHSTKPSQLIPTHLHTARLDSQGPRVRSVVYFYQSIPITLAVYTHEIRNRVRIEHQRLVCLTAPHGFTLFTPSNSTLADGSLGGIVPAPTRLHQPTTATAAARTVPAIAAATPDHR